VVDGGHHAEKKKGRWKKNVQAFWSREGTAVVKKDDRAEVKGNDEMNERSWV